MSSGVELTDGGQAPNPPGSQRSGPVWESSRQLGSGGAGLASLGQGPVAILAGFDLTTVVLLTTGNGHGAVLQAAIACFGLSAALFVLAMAFITTAEDYSATPDVRMTYSPEAGVSAGVLAEQRYEQYQDENLLSIYFNYRVTPTVTLAVLGTLAGLVLVAVGRGWSAGPDIVAGGASVVGLIYIIDAFKNGRNWWLFPRPVFGEPRAKISTRIARAAKTAWSAWRDRKVNRAAIVDIDRLKLLVPPMTEAGLQAMLGSTTPERPGHGQDTTPGPPEQGNPSPAPEDDARPDDPG
jgi:hypothetical protein